jgi:hypothetical protein
MSAKSAGRRDLLDRVIRKHRPTGLLAPLVYTQLIESVRANSSLLSPRSFRSRSQKEKLHHTEGCARAISRMACFHDRMVRSPYTWMADPPSIHSLSRHLFARFDVPEFAHRAWFGETVEARIFLDIARGINPRKAIVNSGLSSRLSKKASHFFANAPDRFGISDTIRWAQLRSFGASDQLATRIVKACQGFAYDEDFWQELAQFLVYACNVQPGKRERSIVAPDDCELKEIAAFVWQQKYVDASRVLGYRVLLDVPLQPNFSFSGRTLKSFRRHMRDWRNEIEVPVSTPIRIAKRNRVWHPSGFRPLVIVEDGISWEFVEILESNQLYIEGGLMRHCVATYEASCFSGRSSIWSLRRKIESSQRRVVTIEVWPESQRIVQAKAKRNAAPTAHSLALIRQWAIENQLAMD